MNLQLVALLAPGFLRCFLPDKKKTLFNWISKLPIPIFLVLLTTLHFFLKKSTIWGDLLRSVRFFNALKNLQHKTIRISTCFENFEGPALWTRKFYCGRWNFVDRNKKERKSVRYEFFRSIWPEDIKNKLFIQKFRTVWKKSCMENPFYFVDFSLLVLHCRLQMILPALELHFETKGKSNRKIVC